LASGLYATRNSVSTRIAKLLAEPLRKPAHLGVRSAIALTLFTIIVLGTDGRLIGRHVAAELRTGAPSVLLPPRILHFPTDRSMGTIAFNGQELPARGTIAVPEGAQVSLTVNETGVTDLSPLAALGENDLQLLSFSNTSVQDNDLAYIQHLTGLKRLSLYGTGIGDEGMYYVQDLTNLERINLNATQITDEGMQYVQNMTQMRELVLNRTNLTDESMQYIAGMTELTYLDMWQVNITDDGLRQLQHLTNMNNLGIEDTQITDAGLEYLAQMANLGYLNIEKTNITNEGLAHLLGLQQLQQILLDDTHIDDNALALLAQLKSLSEIQLPIQISPEALMALKDHPAFANLQALLQSRPTEIHIVDRATQTGISGASFTLDPTSGDVHPTHFHSVGKDGAVMVYRPIDEPGARIRAFADGYVTGEESWDEPVPGRVEIALDKASPIGGIVLDAQGAPVAGATVSVPVLGKHNWDGKENLPHRETTGTDGKWTCSIAPQDLTDFWIALDHPDHATTTYTMAELSIAALRNQTQELRIADAIKFLGIVVDEQDEPIANVRIAEMEPWRRDSTRATGKGAITGTSGTFEIAKVKPGPIKLKITAKGFSSIAKDYVADDGMEPVKIVLISVIDLLGRIVDQNHQPVAEVRMNASQTTDAGVRLSGWTGISDGSGKFNWPEAPRAKLSISLSKEGYKEMIQSVDPDNREHEIVMPSLLLFKGTVVDKESGDPIPEFTLMTGQLGNDMNPFSGVFSQDVQDDQGTFNIDLNRTGSANQRYEVINATLNINQQPEISVIAKGYLPPDPVKTDASAQAPPMTFALERAEPITGRVIGQNGRPVENAKVIAANERFCVGIDWNEPPAHVIARTALTDKAGRFSAVPQRPPYQICVVSELGYALVKDEDHATGGEIALKPWCKLNVVSKRSYGAETIVQVMARQSNGFFTLMRKFELKDSATMQLNGLLTGDAQLMVDVIVPEGRGHSVANQTLSATLKENETVDVIVNALPQERR
jgi:hypothetical protein